MECNLLSFLLYSIDEIDLFQACEHYYYSILFASLVWLKDFQDLHRDIMHFLVFMMHCSYIYHLQQGHLRVKVCPTLTL